MEQHRSRISVSDSESDDQFGRPRVPLSRQALNLPTNEVFLGEKQRFTWQDPLQYITFFIDEDLFCPDLVRNCKSLPVVDDVQDYVEIDELASQLSLHNEVGLPRARVTDSKMGQHVSLKRPKISLTWVLREQQGQPHVPQKKLVDWNGTTADKLLLKKALKPKEKLFSEKYVSERNLSEFRDDSKPNQKSQEPTKVDRAGRFREKCCRQRQGFEGNYEGSKAKSSSQANLTSKNSYLEPPIYITSAQSDSGALIKRYRRRRKRTTNFGYGYNIKNVDEFLSRCKLSSPANIPVVLSNSSILYQTRTGYKQMEIPLPLGMVVNSVFKNQNWLYVQTPHGEEGYVNFNACLPLGIIPSNR